MVDEEDVMRRKKVKEEKIEWEKNGEGKGKEDLKVLSNLTCFQGKEMEREGHSKGGETLQILSGKN